MRRVQRVHTEAAHCVPRTVAPIAPDAADVAGEEVVLRRPQRQCGRTRRGGEVALAAPLIECIAGASSAL